MRRRWRGRWSVVVALALLSACSGVLGMDELPGGAGGDAAAFDTSDETRTPDADAGADVADSFEDTSIETAAADADDAPDVSSLDVTEVGREDAPDGGGEADASDAGDAELDTAPGPDVMTDAAEVGDGAEASADASEGGSDGALDAPETVDAADATDSSGTGDGGSVCSGTPFIGLSEIMVRAVGGTGDTHEWFEITNYSATCTYDVGGLRVRVLSASGASWIERATYTLAAGTSMPPGKAYVFAGLRATFLADAGAYYTAKGLDTSLVFDSGKPLGDVMPNGADLQVEVYAPGATLPTDSVVVKTRIWPVGQSRSLPSPCDPLTARVTGSPATATPYWMDTPISAANQYGAATLGGGGVIELYGTPGRVNDVAATCP